MHVLIILVYIILINILIRIISNILNILSARVFTLYLIISINILRYRLSRFIYNKL